MSDSARIAGLLVLDGRNSTCVRKIDVIVPGYWDNDRCLWEAQRRLPTPMVLVDENPDLVIWYPLDDGPVFADWRTALPSRGQQSLFEVSA